MKLRNLGVLTCAAMMILISACAQAGSFAGKWVGMKYGDVLTIATTSGHSYTGTTQQGFPLYLSEVDGKLVGTVLHVATAKVTIRYDGDANHLWVVLPGPDGAQEYSRARP